MWKNKAEKIVQFRILNSYNKIMLKRTIHQYYNEMHISFLKFLKNVQKIQFQNLAYNVGFFFYSFVCKITFYLKRKKKNIWHWAFLR